MNDYEKLLELTKNKYDISMEFYGITKKIEEKILKDDFYNIDTDIEARQEMIDAVNLLDNQFISLYESLKKEKDFEKNILSYTELKDYIKKIQDNFRTSYNIDKDIIPKMNEEFQSIQKDMKKLKNQETVSDKYSQDIMKKITGENFGVFIDEMK